MPDEIMSVTDAQEGPERTILIVAERKLSDPGPRNDGRSKRQAREGDAGLAAGNRQRVAES